MAGEDGKCCCNHDDHGERDKATQPTSASTASGCCGGASDHEISLSKPHAEQHRAPAAS